jgi:hypothetical protein
MNQKVTSIKIFLLCPIPEEQKPIHEFLNLRKYFLKKKNSFSKQTSITLLKQKKRESFKTTEEENPTFFFKKIQTLLFLFRWKEVEKRLNLSNVFYEEASWYDGQIWEKPFSILKNDRFLNTQFVQSKKK